MITKEQADEKVRAGWMRVWLGFDALAISEEVAKKALESLLNRLDGDQRAKVYKKEVGTGEKVDNPLEGIKEAWSVVAKVEFVAKNLADLFGVVVEYGPSAVELLEPNRVSSDAGDVQGALNTVADMMHRFAAAGVGGAMVVTGKVE